MVYLSFSRVVRSIMLSREYATYAYERRGLRVTDPRGAQRSTPWLSIPYRFAKPLTCIMVLLHWTISESIFVARVNMYDMYHQRKPSADIDTCGWSHPAIIVSLIIGGVLILGLLIMGLRRYPMGIPLASSCSAAISAACHSSTGEANNAAQMAVMYGVLPDKTGSASDQVGFSCRAVRPLEDGHAYSEGYQLRQRCPKPEFNVHASTMWSRLLSTDKRKQRLRLARCRLERRRR